MTAEEQFVVAIDIIADKLGIAATEIFRIFVEAQATIGVLMIARCILIVLSLAVIYFIATKVLYGKYTYHNAVKTINKDDYGSDEAKACVLAIPILTAVIGAFILSFVFDVLTSGILCIMCPEYTAISEIVNLIS